MKIKRLYLFLYSVHNAKLCKQTRKRRAARWIKKRKLLRIPPVCSFCAAVGNFRGTERYAVLERIVEKTGERVGGWLVALNFFLVISWLCLLTFFFFFTAFG